MKTTDFRISIIDPADREEKVIDVEHNSETFDLMLNDLKVSIINNGDNSWSLVEGNLDQETVNLMGTATEQYMNSL